MNRTPITLLKLPDGQHVQLPSRVKPSSRTRRNRFLPHNLSYALASAFNSASSSVSQTLARLSFTLAGLASLQVPAQAQTAAPTSAQLPQGGVAVHGGATFQHNGNTLNVNTANGAVNGVSTGRSIINWQSFNIGAGHTTNINQPNAQSSSLNRVVTNVPSQIYGTLRSNGQVILVNQNGIAVGAGGVVDTASFTASTLNISDADYKAKKLRFEGSALAGGVQIDGVIRSANGDVVLFAPNVSIGKDALVKADNGNVIVGAGQSVEVTGRGLEGVRFVIQSADNKAINLGTLQGNAVGVFAGTLRHSGVIQAQTATMEGGRVLLRAVKDVEIVKDESLAGAPVISANGGLNSAGVAQKGGSIRIESAQGNVTIGAGSSIAANAAHVTPSQQSNTALAGIPPAGGAITIIATEGRVLAEAGSAISATGHPGGTIRIFGGQEARIASHINASSPSLGNPMGGGLDAAGTLALIGPVNTGGTIQILSPQTVNLSTGAQLLASGDAGGGTILVGGDYQGANAEIVNAHDTNISQGVLLEANARVSGNGGKVIVWADNDTYFGGSIKATGGEQGGDGGFGETSGKKHLYFRGRADLSARRGRTGTLLLDPDEILIQGGAGASDANFLLGTIVAGVGGPLATIFEADLETIGATANILLEAANKISFGLVPFAGNGLVVAKDFTLRTTNAIVAPSMGVLFFGWNAVAMPQFTIQAGGNILLEAGTQWTGGANGPNVITTNFSNSGEKVSIISTGGSITMKAAAGIGLGNGTVLQANKNISISSGEFSNSTGGDINFSSFGAVQGVSLTAEKVSIKAQGAGNVISLSSNTTITSTDITAGADGLELIADRVGLVNGATGVALTSVNGLRIAPSNSSRNMILGGTNDTPISTELHLSQAEIATFQAGIIRLGAATGYAGNILTTAGNGTVNFGNTSIVAMRTGGSINLNASNSAITAGQLGLEAGGNVLLTNSAHNFNVIAAKSSTGSVSIQHVNTAGYTLGTVDAMTGATADTSVALDFFNPTGTTGQTIVLKADVLTSGGPISINTGIGAPGSGMNLIDIAAPIVTIDSNQFNFGSSGSIELGVEGSNISVDQTNRALLVDASTSGVGLHGDISLGNIVANGSGNMLNQLTLNTSATAGLAGKITLPSTINLDGGNLLINGRATLTAASGTTINTSGSGLIQFQGELQGNKALLISGPSSVSFEGVVGTAAALASLTVSPTSGNVTIQKALNASGGLNIEATKISIDAAANVIVSSGNIALAGGASVAINGTVTGGGDIVISTDSGGTITMGSSAEITGIYIGAGGKTISLKAQNDIVINKLIGTSQYAAAVQIDGANKSLTTANIANDNFASFDTISLGAFNAFNTGTSIAPIRIANLSGGLEANSLQNLYLSATAGNLTVAAATVNTALGAAVMEIRSNAGIQIAGGAGISVDGLGKAEIKLAAAGTVEVFTGISGNGNLSTVSITANDRIVIGGGATISNLGYISLAGTDANQAIRLVDDDTVATSAGSLNIAYGSLNKIASNVGHVFVGKPDLSNGSITFEGISNLEPTGAKNYSFFTSGSITSAGARTFDLVSAGFKATGDVNLGNVEIVNTSGTNVILAAESGGFIDLRVVDGSVTIDTVGPAGKQITGITATSDITLINTIGSINSGAATFDLYTNGGKVTAKAAGNLGTVAAPLTMHASGFTLGSAGTPTQTLIAAQLTQNSSAVLQTSNLVLDTTAATLTDVYLAAGATNTTLSLNSTLGSSNQENITLVNAGGGIEINQPNAVFSGTGTITFDASTQTTFNTITTITAGHSVTIAPAGNAVVAQTSGWLQGDGTLKITGAGNTLIVNGTVSPGSGAGLGTLTVQGNLTMGSTGVMDLQIGTNATNGDRIAVTDTFNATVGTLRLTESAPSATTAGTAYTLGTAPNFIGSFATLDKATGNFSVALGAGVLTATPLSLTNKWISTSSGIWGAAGANANWSRGITPTAAHDAWIDVAGFDPVVTVGVAAVANSVRVGASDSLTINASLGLAGGMSIGNGATLNHASGGSGTITAGGNITIDAGGVMNWGGGQIGAINDAAQLFTTNGTVNISGPGSSFQTLYRNWSNTGTVNWLGGRETSLAANFSGQITFANSGIINLQSTSTSGITSFIDGGLGSIINTSAGQINVSNTGTHITEINAIQNALTNDGLISVNSGQALVQGPNATAITDSGAYIINAGSTLSFGTSKRTLSATASMSGTGHLQIYNGGTLTLANGAAINPLINGSVEVSSGRLSLQGSAPQITKLTLAGGTIEMPNNLLVDTLVSTGGTFLGAGTLTTGTTASIATNQLIREGGNWVNIASMTLTGGTNIYLNATSTLTNSASGLMDFQATSSSAVSGGSGVNTFNNDGMMINSAGAATRGIFTTFNNTGSVLVDSGVLLLNNTGVESGNYTVAGGATLELKGGAIRNFTAGGLSGTGTLLLTNSSNTTLSNGVNSSLLQNGTVTLNGGNLSLITGSGFTFSNPLSIALGATLTISKAMTGALNVGLGSLASSTGSTWTTPVGSNSFIAPTTGGTFSVAANIDWTNLGTINHSGAGTLLLGEGIVNQGLINLTGNGTLTSTGSSLNNSSVGTVRRSASTGNFTINGVVAQGGTLDVQTGTLTLANALTNNGWITGAATLAVAGTGLNNDSNGTIAPGGAASIATLTIAGNANLAAGKLLFDLNTGALYDRLTVTGNATLGAGLTVNEITSNYSAGDQFTLISYGGAASGSLPVVDTSAISDVTFTRSTTATSNGALLLTTGQVINRWRNASGTNDWNTSTNWSRNHAPTASEDVVIAPSDLDKQVTLSSGSAGLARSLTLSGDDDLHILGQTLTVGTTQAVTVAPGAAITLNVGTLKQSGAGGVLNNSGDLIMIGASTLTIDSINNSGTLQGTGIINAAGGGLNNVGSTSVLKPGDIPLGNAIGTLTINGNLLLGDDSRVVFDLNTAGSDRLNVSGDINFTGSKGPIFLVREFNGPSITGLEAPLTVMTAGGDLIGSTSQYGFFNLTDGISFLGKADLAGKSFTTAVVSITNQWATPTPSGDSWFTAANWSRGIVPNKSHDVLINSGTSNWVTISAGAAEARSLSLGDGLGGNNKLSVSGGSSSLTVNNTLTQTSTLVTLRGGSTLNLAGGATLALGGGSMFVDENAVMNLNASALSAAATGAVGVATVFNSGVINHLAGTSVLGQSAGSTTVKLENLASGTVSVQSGELQVVSEGFEQMGLVSLPSATSTLSYLGGNLNNQGTVTLAGGRLLAGANDILNNGLIRGAGSLVGSLINNLTGTLAPGALASAGVLLIDGDFENASTGTLRIRGFSPTSSDQLEVSGNSSLAGTLAMTGGGTHAFAGGQSYQIIQSTNTPTGGFATVSGIGLLNQTQSSSSSGQFITLANPAGSIVWIGGDGNWNATSNWDLGRLPQAGDIVIINPVGPKTITVNTGTALGVLDFSSSAGDDTIRIILSGDLTLPPPTTLTSINGLLWVDGGALTNSGLNTAKDILITSGQMNLNANLAVATLTLQGGNVSIATGQTLSLGTNGNWNGAATINGGGTFQVSSTGVLTLLGAGMRTISGSTLSNDGEIRLTMDSVADQLMLDAGSILNNNATGTIALTDVLLLSSTTQVIAGDGTLNNLGGTFRVQNNAILNLAMGSLSVAGGTFDAQGTSSGLILIETTQGSYSGNVTLASGATQINEGNHSLNNVTLGGTFGTLIVGGQGSPTVTYNDVTLATGILQINSGTNTIPIGKTLSSAPSTEIYVASDTTGAGRILSNGLLQITDANVSPAVESSSNLIIYQTVTLDNLTLASGGVAQLVSDATLIHGAGNLINPAGAFIVGDGTINVGAGSLINQGTLVPVGPAQVGKLTVQGNADLSSGELRIDLETASQYDKLHVTGELTVSPGLTIKLTEAAPLAGGEVFQPLSYGGTASGGFPAIDFVGASKSFALTQGSAFASAFTLTASGGFVTDIFWDGGGGDTLWSNALNWSTDLLPVANQKVTLNPAGSGSVTIASGTNISGLLGFDLDVTDALFITGGSLGLPAANVSLNGTVNLQGGTLVGNAAGGSFNNSFNWSGGTFSGAGIYAVSSLSLVGGGVRTLSGASIDTGATALGGGRLSLAGGNFNTNAGGFTVNSGATLSFDGGVLSTAALTNNGFVDVNGGSVSLSNTSSVQSGAFRIAAPASMEFENDASLSSASSVTGGAWSIASGKSVNASGSLNRGAGGVTFVGGTLTVGSGFETDELIMLSGGSLASGSNGLLKVNTGWDDSGINTGAVTGFGSATITQQAGDLSFNQDFSVSGAMNLTASAARLLGNSNSVKAGSLFAVAQGDVDLDVVNTSAIGVSSTAGNITLDVTGSTVFNALSTAAGRVATVTSDSNVGQSASINTAGRIVLNLGTNDLGWQAFPNSIAQGVYVASADQVVLISGAASPMIFSGNASDVQLGGGAIQLGSAQGALNVTGPLTVVASGNISQGAALNISGITDLSSSAGNISLATASTYSGNLLLSTPGAATINALGAINFGLVGVNNLTLTATGAVSQSSSMNVSGAVLVQAPGQSITLTQAGNAIGSFAAAGSNLLLVSTQTVNPDIDASGNVSITAPGISQSAGNAINSAAFSANVAVSIGLLGDNNLGSVSATAGADIDIRDVGSNLILVQLNAGSSNTVSINSTGAVTQAIGGQVNASQVSLTGASLGTRTKALEIDATAQVRLNATQGDAFINNVTTAAHDLAAASAQGTLRYQTTSGSGYAVTGNVAAANVELLSSGALQIGGGSVSGSGPVLVNASSSVLLSATDITVGSATAIASSSVLSNGSLTINASGNLDVLGGGQSSAFASVDAAGPVDVVVAGAIQVTGGAGQNAYARLDPAAGSLMSVTAASVNLQGGTGAGAYAAIISGGDIVINAGSLDLAAGTGLDADAVIVSNFGRITAPGNCNGCVDLNISPLGNGLTSSGLYNGGAIISQANSTSVISTQLLQIETVLDNAQTDPEDDRRRDPEIVVEGQTCL